MAKTNWQMGDTVQPADLNQIGQEINENTTGVQQVTNDLDRHLAETMIQTAIGTANSIVINTGGDFKYAQGNWIQFKAVTSNTGNVTLNIDGKGAKPFLKIDGSQIPAGGVKSPKVYKAYYDESNGGRFFLLASAEGDAVAGNVLAGKIFSNDEDVGIVGTMPNNGARNGTITQQNGQITIPTGYTTGGIITAQFANLSPANVREGVNIGGVTGNLKAGTPQIYDLGNEIVPFVQGVNLPDNSGTFTKFSNYLRIRTSKQASVNYDISCVTVSRIDVSNVLYLVVDINGRIGQEEIPSGSFVILSTNQMGDVNNYSLRYPLANGRQVYCFDIRNERGQYYIRIHNCVGASANNTFYDTGIYRILTVNEV